MPAANGRRAMERPGLPQGRSGRARRRSRAPRDWMNEAVSDIIVARSRVDDRLSTMIVWSFAAHVVVVAIGVYVQSTQPDPPRQ